MSDPRETTDRSADAAGSGSDNAALQAPGSGDDPRTMTGADQDLQTDSRPGGDASTDMAEEEKEALVAEQQKPDGDTAVGRS